VGRAVEPAAGAVHMAAAAVAVGVRVGGTRAGSRTRWPQAKSTLCPPWCVFSSCYCAQLTWHTGTPPQLVVARIAPIGAWCRGCSSGRRRSRRRPWCRTSRARWSSPRRPGGHRTMQVRLRPLLLPPVTSPQSPASSHQSPATISSSPSFFMARGSAVAHLISHPTLMNQGNVDESYANELLVAFEYSPTIASASHKVMLTSLTAQPDPDRALLHQRFVLQRCAPCHLVECQRNHINSKRRLLVKHAQAAYQLSEARGHDTAGIELGDHRRLHEGVVTASQDDDEEAQGQVPQQRCRKSCFCLFLVCSCARLRCVCRREPTRRSWSLRHNHNHNLRLALMWS
jgi:hypothetical protein